MNKLLKIEKEIKKYVSKLRDKMMNEIISYVRDEIPFKKLTKGSQQILRKLGIYYKKDIYKWNDLGELKKQKFF